MRRPGFPTIVVALALGTALSCGDPVAPPATPDPWEGWESWKVSFLNEQSGAWSTKPCAAGYCKDWSSDVYTFSGTLRHKGSVWSLTVDREYRATDASTYKDSLSAYLRLEYCNYYHLTIAPVGDSIAGTFNYNTDCRVADRKGRFTGRR
jgi:hypothetical protein